jgi:membrane-associated protease RseP (regulator of RpoE activity)
MTVWTGAVVCLLLMSPAPQVTLDRILAVVEGDLITLSDVRAARMLALVPAAATEVMVVDILVERRLVLAEMRRFQVADPSPAALAVRKGEWQSRMGTVTLTPVFEAAGVSPEFLDRWLTDDLRREAYLDQRFAALDAARRVDAIRLWIEGLRSRANISYRIQRF